MCVGKIILYISIIIQVLFFLLFIVGTNEVFNPIKMICLSIPYSLFIFISSKIWLNIVNEMCSNGLDLQSIMVLLSPVIYVLVCIMCYFLGMILNKIFNIGAGKKIQNIKITNEFKEYIDNSDFNLIEYDKYKKNVLEKYDEKTKEKILHNELFLNKGWTINNMVNNPYSFEIIGNNRNSDKRGLIILDKKTSSGWSGYLKIVKFSIDVDSNISNYSNTEIINEENGYEIEFKTTSDYQDIMEIKGVGNDRGIYSSKMNLSVWRILLNVIILIIIVYIFYLAIFKY